MNEEDDIVVESQFFSGENFKSHKYQMKFDVKGWNRERYVGVITDDSFLQAMLDNIPCKFTFKEVRDAVVEQVTLADIIAGKGRVSHRF